MADATRKGVSQTAAQQQADERAEDEDARDLNNDLPADSGDDAPPAAATDAAADAAAGKDKPAEKPVNPRRSEFESAVLARRKAVREELVDAETMEPLEPAADDGAEGEADDEGDAAAAAKPATQGEDKPAAEPDLDMTRKVKLKVYGEEREVTLEEAIRMAQRGEAAQKKFDDAERIKREAEELIAGHTKPTRAAGADEAPSDDGGAPKKPAAAPEKKGADLKELAKAIQFGDEDQAAEALRTLLDEVGKGRADGTTPEGLDEEKVNELVETRLARREAVTAYQRDLETVGVEYPTIFNDPDFTYLAAQRVHQIRARDLVEAGYPEEDVKRLLGNAQGQQRIMQVHTHLASRGTVRGNIEVFREACNDVGKKFGFKQPGQQTPPTRQNRVEEKRTLTQPPAARSARAPTGQDTPKPPSRSDAIVNMRKARGQPV